LNGGALVAIPAAVTLFGVDAKFIKSQLLIAGGLFAFGLILSWLSGFGGFFALSNRADGDFATSEATRQRIYKLYYPSDDEEQKTRAESEIAEQNKESERFSQSIR
jgi:hypothetical protein